MTEQELRDKRFNIVSDYCFGRFDLDTMVDKIYSLAQETIEKQKKEIEEQTKTIISNGESLMEYEAEVKAKNAEIASIFSLLVERDKAIAEARELLLNHIAIFESQGLQWCCKKDIQEAKAWLDSNKWNLRN